MSTEPGQSRVRKFALIGALIGGILGLLLTGYMVWKGFHSADEMMMTGSMLVISMGAPAGVLIGAVAGIFLGEHTGNKK